ncbi:MAG: TerB N-terminal domain-containing protein, partial [Lachnospiraceae bacterium]|nr:TerB N-terminal domain-containing protein [Lachnospiraceae bacterium]
MDPEELTAYAAEQYNIEEEHKWDEFPGFSVLADPLTGKWAALLMRQWDYETGTEISICDIKCGRECLEEISAPWLSGPFRMKGNKWVGVRFCRETDKETVLSLFDRALESAGQSGFTVVLDNTAAPGHQQYKETPISFGRDPSELRGEPLPEEIRRMISLYRYGDGSFQQKCRNFYVQGKLMEDYEDNVPWHGEIMRYFPTYHDLRPDRLRGYFTWRGGIRRGEYSYISTSMAYMYLYELLNGIGTSSPEDSLKKMKEFEEGFIDPGIGDEGIRNNIHRWMLELAVL